MVPYYDDESTVMNQIMLPFLRYLLFLLSRLIVFVALERTAFALCEFCWKMSKKIAHSSVVGKFFPGGLIQTYEEGGC